MCRYLEAKRGCLIPEIRVPGSTCMVFFRAPGTLSHFKERNMLVKFLLVFPSQVLKKLFNRCED